jgi:hypothetical protein
MKNTTMNSHTHFAWARIVCSKAPNSGQNDGFVARGNQKKLFVICG